jgi:hypothetical protein
MYLVVLVRVRWSDGFFFQGRVLDVLVWDNWKPIFPMVGLHPTRDKLPKAEQQTLTIILTINHHAVTFCDPSSSSSSSSSSS